MKRLWCEVVAPALMVFALVALIILGNWATGEAHAVASDATARPEVLWPIPAQVETAHPYAIAIHGPRNTWGLRRFAREADRELPGIRIYTGRDSCANHPRATCLRVHSGDYGANDMGAWVTYDDADGHRDMTLNTFYAIDASTRYAYVCHEFGHVLGLQHHRLHGVDGGWPNEIHLSPSEIRALNGAYPA